AVCSNNNADLMAGNIEAYSVDHGFMIIACYDLFRLENMCRFHYNSPFRFIRMSKKIKYGAPSNPVIIPTGNLYSKANCPIRSAAKTKLTPTRPAGMTLEKPTPTSLFAIGPERKETKAIGPVVAVAIAIMQT